VSLKSDIFTHINRTIVRVYKIKRQIIINSTFLNFVITDDFREAAKILTLTFRIY